VGLSSTFLWRPRLVRAVRGGGRFYHSLLVGNIVRRALPRVSINVAGLKPIQIYLLSPLAAESLLPPARKL
jgi:hypothetical protein